VSIWVRILRVDMEIWLDKEMTSDRLLSAPYLTNKPLMC